MHIPTSLIALALAVAHVACQFQFDLTELAVSDEEELLSHSKASLLWGPYRSSLYVGIRPQIPRSLLSGLFWFNVDSHEGIDHIRHFYNQEDLMRKANWIRYDPRVGGRQVISDEQNHIDVVTDFVKSKDGLSWALQVSSKPHEGYENVKTSFVWYSGLEFETEGTGYIKLDNQKDATGYGSVTLRGISKELGLFELTVRDSFEPQRIEMAVDDAELDANKFHVLSLYVPNDNVWRAKDIFMTMLEESIEKIIEQRSGLEGFPPEQAFLVRDFHNFEGNLNFAQKVYRGAAQFEIVFNNDVTRDKLTHENLPERIGSALTAVDEKFRLKFELQAPYQDQEHYSFSQEMLSGLLGGLAYFYGNQVVDRETVFDEELFESHELNGKEEGPFELLTLVPSRPFFPRGFLWDEGFHLMPLLEYDSDLVSEVLKSWFNLVDDDGWIAREQILGPELHSRVPREFLTQSPEIANPPTLMLVVAQLLQGLDVESPNTVSALGSMESDQTGRVLLSNKALLREFASLMYPKLQRYFDRFCSTQTGYIAEFNRGSNKQGYRWRGRTLTHTFASGLDDYPRALPADVAELNVDLLSWVGMMARTMKTTAAVLGEALDYGKYSRIEQDVIANINALHWSEEERVYCDVSVNSEEEDVHVCHKGYVTLFPMLTKLIAPEETGKIALLVDLISDPDELWTPFGIRSLSKKDQHYRTAENYWRSPIWVNINYLVLDAFDYYFHSTDDEALKRKINGSYSQLRRNVVDNVFSQWKLTGFVWENYDDQTGAAKGAKNFLGWSSLVLLMMRMPEHLTDHV